MVIWHSQVTCYLHICCSAGIVVHKVSSLLFLQIHLGPVKVMKYSHAFDSVISADDKGIIEYWNPATLHFPENGYVLCSKYMACYSIIPETMLIIYERTMNYSRVTVAVLYCDTIIHIFELAYFVELSNFY